MTDIAGKGFLQVYTHNLKAEGSTPTPATKCGSQLSRLARGGIFCFFENFPQSNQIECFRKIT